MAIGSVDTKILWGRAGGRCSMPGCNEVLTSLVESGNYVVGEMAHVKRCLREGLSLVQ